jgi:hypothetical protein
MLWQQNVKNQIGFFDACSWTLCQINNIEWNQANCMLENVFYFYVSMRCQRCVNKFRELTKVLTNI